MRFAADGVLRTAAVPLFGSPTMEAGSAITLLASAFFLKELRRMAGEVKNIRTLKNTLEELNNTAHSTVQQFRANANDLLDTLKFVKDFGTEVKGINQEIRAIFVAETNGAPSDPSEPGAS